MLYYILYFIPIIIIYKYNYIFYFCYYRMINKKALMRQINTKLIDKYEDL